MRFLVLFISSFFAVITHAATPTPHHPITHVILITLDGIRREDFFGQRQLMPIFWRDYAKQAVLYGEPGSSRTMTVGAHIPYSLPSYQSMMTGIATPCMDNDCGAVKMQTFPEALVTKARLKRSAVASISSWEVMDDAFESQLGTAFSNHGTRPMHDPDKFTTDAAMATLNKQQVKAYQGDDIRLDKDTLAQAIHYYQTYQPSFLWISFGDADEYAHAGNMSGYQNTLAFYDNAIQQIINMTRRAGLDEETMFIITTDHGRGSAQNWKEHEPEMPTAWQTFAVVIHGKLSGGIKHGHQIQFSTLSIRPTIEKIFKT